ncbi:hypothetical protein QVD17_32007 [Tagetes erecta]|uniref:GRF-type domain-containing protein n=1 Tax=Tagetes erecta TaxID=13708 RepID=A0AAD8K5F6_TARER|nr:hypothetical protein QVD17_32007 [Tagetes erecta]
MEDQRNNVLCSCGSRTSLATSWTRFNHGRRFYCCARKVRSFGFVVWADSEICRRAREPLPLLGFISKPFSRYVPLLGSSPKLSVLISSYNFQSTTTIANKIRFLSLK